MSTSPLSRAGKIYGAQKQQDSPLSYSVRAGTRKVVPGRVFLPVVNLDVQGYSSQWRPLSYASGAEIRLFCGP
jgi:hypothetical protein